MRSPWGPGPLRRAFSLGPPPLGLRAVRRGFHVVAVHHPSGYGSSAEVQTGLPDFAYLGPNYGKNRLHRLAILGYGTLFGLDMMGSSRAVDLLLTRADVDAGRIGIYGGH